MTSPYCVVPSTNRDNILRIHSIQRIAVVVAALLLVVEPGIAQSQFRLLPLADQDRANVGMAVDIHSDLAVVGSPAHDSTGGAFGAAYVIGYNGAAWVAEDTLYAVGHAQLGSGFVFRVGDKFIWVCQPNVCKDRLIV